MSHLAVKIEKNYFLNIASFVHELIRMLMLKFEWIIYVFNSFIRFLLIFIEVTRWDPPLTSYPLCNLALKINTSL